MSYDAYSLKNDHLIARPVGGAPYRVTLHRKISTRFATTSYGEVIKLSNGEILPGDEPLFVLRARDVLAIPMLLHFEELIKQQNYDFSFILELGNENQRLFKEFAKEHPERMKLPGVTKGK
jgi:hypothetical protein